MSQSIQETTVSVVQISSGLNGTTLATVLPPGRRSIPIRLYVYGATEASGGSGVSTYFVTMRRSKYAADETTLANVQPSGIVALTKTDNIYKVFTSGYEPTPIGTINVEHAPYFLSTGILGIYRAATPTTMWTGMIYPDSSFVYSSNFVYMFEYYEWEANTFYWFYVGAKDKAGNSTKFQQMYSHPQNPWSGMIPNVIIPLPLEDITAPSGMIFFV